MSLPMNPGFTSSSDQMECSIPSCTCSRMGRMIGPASAEAPTSHEGPPGTSAKRHCSSLGGMLLRICNGRSAPSSTLIPPAEFEDILYYQDTPALVAVFQ